MENKRYDEEIELLQVEFELLDMSINAVGELREYELERARLMGAAAVRLLEQSDEQEVISLVKDAENILDKAARLTRPFTAEIKNGMIRAAIESIVAPLDKLEGIDDAHGAAEATGKATDDAEEENPYKELCENLMDAAELLRASGALLPEFVEMREAGLHKARLMLAIALAELCE